MYKGNKLNKKSVKALLFFLFFNHYAIKIYPFKPVKSCQNG